MSELIVPAAADFLALVCFVSALAKTIQQPDPFRAPGNWVLAVANARWFAAVEAGMGALLALPTPLAAQALAAILLAVIVVDGQFWHAKNPAHESDDFGSITPHSQALYFSIGVAVSAAAVAIGLAALRAPLARAPFDARFGAAMLILLLAVAAKLAYDQARGQGYAKKDVTAVDALPADLPIGSDAAGALTAGDLAALGRATLIVGISPHSRDCLDVYALLARHAQTLSKELTVVVVAQNDIVYRNAQNASLRRLVDSACHLSRFLGLRTRPYAMLVNQDLSLFAAPSQSSAKVQRLITLLVTQIQNAPASYLTFGDANR
ncbi:MAG TPA: hypothetical protein VFB32_10565 [Rudaea sp.]|nr:hypothetical protein [Rudaea sp.]